MAILSRIPRTFMPFIALFPVTACKSVPHSPGQADVMTTIASPTTKADCAPRLSDVGAAIHKKLGDAEPGLNFWDLSCNNFLPKDWLIVTPQLDTWEIPSEKFPQHDWCEKAPDCDTTFLVRTCDNGLACGKGRCTPVGYSKSLVCAGHSDHLFDHLYDLVSRATQRVDITTLGSVDDVYQRVFVNALKAADNQNKVPPSPVGQVLDVRILGTGEPAGAEKLGQNIFDGLSQTDASKANRWRVASAVHGNFTNWNHAKIVVVDGSDAIVGGHNWWASDYNREKPMFDVSMRLQGNAALAAQRFADILWSSTSVPVRGFSLPSGKSADARLPPMDGAKAAAIKGNVAVFSVGTEGGLIRGPRPGASDLALYAMIDQASHTVTLSQMDLVSPYEISKRTGKPYAQFVSSYLLEHLGRALMRGVEIKVVLSHFDDSDKISAGYSHRWPLAKIASAIKTSIVASLARTHAAADIETRLCESFTLAHAKRMPGDELTLNHAKVMIVDDKTFYVGSQNLYPGGLADNWVPQLVEFGWIVDDKAAADRISRDYWDRLWKHSQTTAVSGGSRPTSQCAFR